MPDRSFASLCGWLFAAHGVYLMVAAVALGVLSWLIPGLLEKIASSDAIDPADVPPLVQQLIDHRLWLRLLGLPAFTFGLLLTLKARFRWLWIVLGLLSLLAPAVLLIYGFVVLIGPLYESRPL